MKEDTFWKELKDDWTGRIYRTFGDLGFGDLDGRPIFIIKDLGDTIVYTRSPQPDAPMNAVEKDFMKKKIEKGIAGRIR